ncbi:hypothetical protein PCK2_000910, partial [Pneumocystis canis]
SGGRGVQVLKKRDQAVAGKVNVEAEHLLAFILKEKAVNDGECQTELEQYCGELKNANLTSEDIHDKLTGYCKDDGKAEPGKCDELTKKVKAKCDELKTALDKALKALSEENCTTYEHECLFLEGADPNNLKEPCSNLRTKCYELKRQKVRDEVLMRALKGALKQQGNDACQTALKKHCVTLGPMSPDLMHACLVNGTCTYLVMQAQTKCVLLKTEVGNALKDLDNTKCLPLLEECHFYGPNCEGDKKPECEKLKKQCEEKDVEYMPPEGPFIPIDPTVTVLERVGLDMLYKEAAKEGNIDDWSKECQKNLTEVCRKVKHQSVELLSLCIQPKETCDLLHRDIQDKTYQLTKPLTFLRDSPKKEECIKLGTRCNLLQ